ncbi:MAG: TetR/AcrR family transcriptional regulator [Peptococcaceae bacterium]|nr:TetR/AcrR family transcriptional regulator [Peptococcaceae bacterium]
MDLDYRQRILAAGAEEFHIKGFNAADMRSIAARASTAVGTIYNHFPDKLSLFHAIAWEQWQRLEQKVQEISASDHAFRHKLYCIGELHLQFTDQHRAVFRAITASSFDMSHNPKGGFPNELLEPYLRLLAQTFAEQAGSNADDLRIKQLAALFFSGLALFPAILPDHRQEHLEFLISVIESSLATNL